MKLNRQALYLLAITYISLYGMNSESVDLIYLDLPFNSEKTYPAPAGSKAACSSFKDVWAWQYIDQQ